MPFNEPDFGNAPLEQREEEVRTLLLRLLRLVAAEVAAQLQERDRPATSRNQELAGRQLQQKPESAHEDPG
jgi:hypothetical protein